MDAKSLERSFFLFVLAVVAAVVFFIFRPYFNSFILAGTFALVFKPVQRSLTDFFGGREGIAALCTMLLVILVVLTPLVFLGVRVFEEAAGLYTRLSGTEGDVLLNTLIRFAQERSEDLRFIPFTFDVTTYVRNALTWILQNIGPLFSGVAQVVANFFIGLLIFFYLLKDGKKLEAAIFNLSPLSRHYTEEILERIEKVLNSIVKDSLLVAIVQGIFTGIGFGIFGVPSPAFWGSIAVIAALIPFVGPAIIIIPGAAYLVLTQNLFSATGLVIWGVVIVGLVDNLLRPQLLKRSVHMHPLLVLLSVLGGITLFGPVGFLVGPVILGLLFALIDIYPHVVLAKNTPRE